MVQNSLWFVDLKNLIEYSHYQLNPSYSKQKDFYFLVDQKTKKAFDPRAEFFMKFWSRMHKYDVTTRSVSIPLAWSAQQMAVNYAYQNFLGKVDPIIHNWTNQLRGDYLAASANEAFGEGRKITIPQKTNLTTHSVL